MSAPTHKPTSSALDAKMPRQAGGARQAGPPGRDLGGRDNLEFGLAVRGDELIIVCGAQAHRFDRFVGFDSKAVARDPSHGAEHRFMAGKENGDAFADLQRVRTLAADAGNNPVARDFLAEMERREQAAAPRQQGSTAPEAAADQAQ